MENEENKSESENAATVEENNTKEAPILEIGKDGNPEILSRKDSLIAEIMKQAKIKEDLVTKNNNLQYMLSAYIKESAEKDYFQTLDLPLDANEPMYKANIKKIDKKKQELEQFSEEAANKLELLKIEIKAKQQEFSEIKVAFTALKEKVALQSVNSENGDQYTKQEVQDLLKKEEDMRKTLEHFQLEAIKKRHILNSALKEKKNLVEGPLDYNEYEIMCTKTENNIEVIKQLKQEMKDFSTKSTNVVNILSHLSQKLHSLQNEKSAAEEKEKFLEEELDGMRTKLFKEKMKYGSMNAKNKELQDKCILLQHPRLLEDHKNIVGENEKAKKEIEELKNTYEALTKSISQ